MFYTYYVKAEGKYYFGSRTRRIMLKRAAKDDFMIHYFTSTTDERLREIIRKGEYEKAEIIKEYTNRQECLKDEELLIENFWWLYGTENCWNHQANGKFSMSGRPSPMLGKQHSEETKKKLSEAKRGKHHTEEHNKKIGEALKGEKNPLFGKHPSKETRKKLSEALKGEKNPLFGKHPSKETRKKLSEARKGKHLSKETKKKLSESHKGKYPSKETRKKLKEAKNEYFKTHDGLYKGKHHTEETRKKLSEALIGRHHSEETKQKMRCPRQKFKYQTPSGKIKIMASANAKRWHKDWIEIGPEE